MYIWALGIMLLNCLGSYQMERDNFPDNIWSHILEKS
uniref:Uncharacterized protein n=1 Tax=Rhizophora mucronata TaxID=61149 RepID=A0A2P2LMF9_RHIMU